MICALCNKEMEDCAIHLSVKISVERKVGGLKVDMVNPVKFKACLYCAREHAEKITTLKQILSSSQ